jgi:hypothetical protein
MCLPRTSVRISMALAFCKTSSVEVFVERCLMDLRISTSRTGSRKLHVLSTPRHSEDPNLSTCKRFQTSQTGRQNGKNDTHVE